MAHKDISGKEKEALFIWAHKLKYKKIDDKNTLCNFFEYKGTNLWEFCIVGFCQELTKGKEDFSKMKHFMKTFLFPKVELIHDIFSYVFSNFIYKSYGAKIKHPILISTIDRDWRISKAGYIADQLNSLAAFNCSANNKPIRKNKLVYYNDCFYDTTMDFLNEKGKPFLLMGENYAVQNLSLQPYSLLFKRRLDRPDIPYVSIESFFNLKALKEEHEAREHFKAVWNELKRKKTFRNAFVFRGEDLFPIVYPFFEYCFLALMGRKIKLIEMSKKLIKKINPSVILMQNESANWEQTLIYAAKQLNVKTIAIQHGVVYRLHEGYFHIKDKKQNYPFADLTAVYGPETKRILVDKNNCPKDKVVVTGTPRYDKIRMYLDKSVRENFFKRNKLDKNKKLFLIASSIISATGEDFPIKTFQILKDFKDIQIAIKIHPSEADVEFYKKIIKKFKINVVFLGKDQDLFEAIAACDYFVSLESTSALEAMILDKPIIISNFSSSPGTMPWVEENAAVNITSVEEGKKIIGNVLKNPKSLDWLMINEKKFLEKYYYKIDGKATERLYSLFGESKNE